MRSASVTCDSGGNWVSRLGRLSQLKRSNQPGGYWGGLAWAAETDKASTTMKAWPACQMMLLLRPGGAKRACDSVRPLRTLKVLARISLAINNSVSSAMGYFNRWNVSSCGGDFAGFDAIVFFLDPGDG